MRSKEYPIGDYVGKCQTWNPKSSGAGSFDYIDLSSVDKDTKTIASIERYECSDAPSRARQLVETDDVLVATVRPNLNGVALVNGAHHGMTASTGYCVLRPDQDKLDSRFLFHWVKTGVFVQRMVDVATGANYPAVSDAKVKASKISLPPLAEQKRIAAILDAADTLRAKRRESLAQLDTLLQSTFLDMFGDPVTNPMGWPMNNLQDLCAEITDIDHKMPKAVDSGFPLISAKDLADDGSISFESVKRISDEDFRRLSRKSKPQRGDIIYSRIGVKLGKARLVEVDFEFLASYSCCTIRPNRELVDTRFLCSLLDSPFILRQAQDGVRAIAVPDLGLGKIKAFKIINPPRDRQRASPSSSNPSNNRRPASAPTWMSWTRSLPLCNSAPSEGTSEAGWISPRISCS